MATSDTQPRGMFPWQLVRMERGVLKLCACVCVCYTEGLRTVSLTTSVNESDRGILKLCVVHRASSRGYTKQKKSGYFEFKTRMWLHTVCTQRVENYCHFHYDTLQKLSMDWNGDGNG